MGREKNNKGRTVADVERALEGVGGPEWLWERLAGLSDLDALAEELGVGLRALYRWKDSTAERAAEWDACLTASADAYAADAFAILDDLASSPLRIESAQVALATARAKARERVAAIRNAAAWGEKPQTAVQVNVDLGQLHLEALKASGSMALSRPAEPPVLIGTPISAGVAPAKEATPEG